MMYDRAFVNEMCRAKIDKLHIICKQLCLVVGVTGYQNFLYAWAANG